MLVLVDQLDAAAARAIQYARTLTPDELRAVHFDLDPMEDRASSIEAWQRARAVTGFPLDIVECPDRRIARAALELAAELAADGDTEVTVLIPRREYTQLWHRLLHDRTADSIAEALGDTPALQRDVRAVPPRCVRPRGLRRRFVDDCQSHGHSH